MTLDTLIKRDSFGVALQPAVSVRQKTLVGWVARAYSGPSGEAGVRTLVGKENLSVDFERWYREQALAAYKVSGQRNLLMVGFETAVLEMGVAGSGHLAAQVKEKGLAPEEIVIAVRESKVDDPELLKDFVQRHRSQGFLIALKDMGTGHSNLERLAVLQPDVLFVGKSLTDQGGFVSREIMKSLASLSKRIGALLVAEEISSPAQALAALDAGVDMLEGPLFSPSADDLLGDIARLAQQHRSAVTDKSKTAQTRLRETDRLLSELVKDLAGRPLEEFDPALAAHTRRHPHIECLFVLDENGVQESQTHSPPDVAFKRNALFHPARPGVDHSAKEYVYLLDEAFVHRYRTEPYVSQASGHLCVTLSALFKDQAGRVHILCLDLPWVQQ